LVLIVTASALQLGIPAYRQHVAVQDIERLGGRIISFAGGPHWLRSWLGDDRMKLFDVVDSVRFTDGVNATDEALARLPAFARLRELDIGDIPGAPLTAAGVARAGNLMNLEVLYLRDTALDDAGLAALPELPKLKRLYLAKTRVTDAGLARLTRFA